MGLTEEEFKKALGSHAEGLSDAEISRLNDLTEKLSGVLFDMWQRKIQTQETKV